MVVNATGRVVHATSQLASMLGYPRAAMDGVELAALIPPPLSQMHAKFLKVRAAPSPPHPTRGC
jgi:PAS domain-containing protein